MAISFLQNLPALAVQRRLAEVVDKTQDTMERVASGKRILRAGDDAAGLSIGENIEGRVKSVRRAQKNAMEAISLVQVAEGGMNEVSNILIRLRELAIQAASDSVSGRERALIELEARQLEQELDRLAYSTKYFGTELLSGNGREFSFQVGPDNDEFNVIKYDTRSIDLKASTLGIDDVSLTDKDDARDSLGVIDEALLKLGKPRAEIGAIQGRIQTAISQLGVQEETLTAAHSRIMDADLARESTELVRLQVQQRAAAAVLAQANQLPMQALKLLTG